ncbi:glycosyl hydrolase [Sphingobium sp. CAP-1]|uniref:glycosyl hydrolase n=1 Tax=Sphingobium sp. CAP-1 TaxID=2676077 RepID=UPI0012BB2C18|nr:glycosyl hydrolase [Sphingobium sp. CAP-1]QGP81183.1 glycoside hydrolase [Sphingobium sp. CAP-1]
MKKQHILRSSAASILLLSSVAWGQSDPLLDGFRDPPASARPHVWWHWMNGNIESDGAKRDLEWMKRIGIGGVHLFEAGMGVPTIVPQRRIYMSAPWRKALRDSVATAAALDLPLGIATSGGWSATGGPWVRPDDAMKKLVWSETRVAGGGRFTGRLTPPPTVAGPYQDVPLTLIQPAEAAGPALYRDARVIAMPAGPDDPTPAQLTLSAGKVDGALLADGQYGPATILPAQAGAAWIAYRYDRPQTIRSATVGLPGPRGFGTPAPPMAMLEASDDGLRYRPVADLPASTSPVRSASFAPVTARWFRLTLTADPKPGFMDKLTYAPGALRPPFPTGPAASYALSEFALHAEARVRQAEEKAGFATLPDYYAAATPPAAGIAPVTIIDLTDRMRPDGTLDWTPPPGRWRVLRMGWSLTGHRNGPAPQEATGLEVDKLSAPRVAGYIDHFLSLYRQSVGDDLIGAQGIRSILSDSIESGPQNWTDDLPAQFARRRGYDPTPWLPALTGIVIGDAARTDAFLWDWRKTIADLYAEAHYGVLSDAAHKAGMTYYAEALEDHRPQLGDDLAMRAHADVPMGAMWTLAPGAAPNPSYVADIKGAASVANLYGKAAVGAESLTAFGHPFAYAPADLKATADLEFALGVNRLLIHTSAHQPFADRAPGFALATFLGQYFTRNETWAEMADGWTTYLARTSFLLQQGHHVADIAYFYGEESPITGLYGDAPVGDVPTGHDYDFVNADALASRLRVEDGRLATPDGQSYRLLYLGGSSGKMTLATLRRIEALVQAGAVVVGRRPAGSPSLSDDPAEVAALIDRLWSGRIGTDLTRALSTIGPDWRWEGEGSLALLHRANSESDIYFISNRSGKAVDGMIDLRVSGRRPELWRADDGRVESVSYDMDADRTRIPLHLARDEALFVVLRQPTADRSARIVPPQSETLAQLGGDWRMTFDARPGAPAGERSGPLGDWSRSDDPATRYYSGVASYSRGVTLPKGWKPGRGRLLIDLGTVADVAEVRINGQRAGVAWKAPYRLDITPFVKPGRNALTVRVANLWVNRLIGDAQPGATPVTLTTGPTYAADAPLRPSGLIGPVVLIGVKED